MATNEIREVEPMELEPSAFAVPDMLGPSEVVEIPEKPFVDPRLIGVENTQRDIQRNILTTLFRAINDSESTEKAIKDAVLSELNSRIEEEEEKISRLRCIPLDMLNATMAPIEADISLLAPNWREYFDHPICGPDIYIPPDKPPDEPIDEGCQEVGVCDIWKNACKSIHLELYRQTGRPRDISFDADWTCPLCAREVEHGLDCDSNGFRGEGFYLYRSILGGVDSQCRFSWLDAADEGASLCIVQGPYTVEDILQCCGELPPDDDIPPDDPPPGDDKCCPAPTINFTCPPPVVNIVNEIKCPPSHGDGDDDDDDKCKPHCEENDPDCIPCEPPAEETKCPVGADIKWLISECGEKAMREYFVKAGLDYSEFISDGGLVSGLIRFHKLLFTPQ